MNKRLAAVDYSYPTILAAAQGLLSETVALVRPTNLEFVVIGGWSPYLLNGHPVRHPGSRDVDLLFKKGATGGALKPAFDVLRSNGFFPSAKHDFQLLRVLAVGDEKFVFNIDLLHADEAASEPHLFADHVSLPVRLSEFSSEKMAQRSIRVPFSDFLFDGHIVEHSLSSTLPDGSIQQCQIPLMDEVGTLVTKAESMLSPKRCRDAFDIVVAITQARDPAALCVSLQRLASGYKNAFDELTKLWGLCTNSKLRENVGTYWPEAKHDENWEAVAGKIGQILNQANVPQAESGSR